MTERLALAALGRLREGVAAPGYDPRERGTGIVHIGAGAFHRAHQAVYTDAALATGPGDWRIAGVSLRSIEVADALDAQDGLFTVMERDGAGDRARVVGSVARVLAASRDPGVVPAALADPAIRVVTLTVTEKAYGIDRAAQDIDPTHGAIGADLAAPRAPSGVIGLLVEGLRRRHAVGVPPFTVLCCDNLSDNGALLRTGVLAFARRVDPDLARRIESEVAFPSSMVDRITPAPTEATRALAHRLTGLVDAAAIETEPFSQWVVEDRFPRGRPAWEAGGALFVRDVAPYERMKLRMLNGAHSLIAYAGFLSGHALVRDAMADDAMAALVRRHLAAAAQTLEPLPGIDLDAYAGDLMRRFANPAIAHETYQIAMDGTEKLPQRIADPALDCLGTGQDLRPFAFAFAAWARYCLGTSEAGERYDLRDPRGDRIAEITGAAGGDAHRIVRGLLSLPGVFPERLAGADGFTRTAAGILASILKDGMAAAIAAEAAEIQ